MAARRRGRGLEARRGARLQQRSWRAALLRPQHVDADGAQGARHRDHVGRRRRLQGTVEGVAGGVPQDQPAVARPASRVRVAAGRGRGAAGAGARSARARVDHDDGAVRQPAARDAAARGDEAGARRNLLRRGVGSGPKAPGSRPLTPTLFPQAGRGGWT